MTETTNAIDYKNLPFGDRVHIRFARFAKWTVETAQSEFMRNPWQVIFYVPPSEIIGGGVAVGAYRILRYTFGNRAEHIIARAELKEALHGAADLSLYRDFFVTSGDGSLYLDRKTFRKQILHELGEGIRDTAGMVWDEYYLPKIFNSCSIHIVAPVLRAHSVVTPLVRSTLSV